MENESAATDGLIESNEKALCIGYSNGENSLFSADQLFNEREGNIKALEVQKTQKRTSIVLCTVDSMTRMCIVIVSGTVDSMTKMCIVPPIPLIACLLCWICLVLVFTVFCRRL